MNDVFTYHVMRDEWVAQIGWIEPDGNSNSFRPYWTSDPYPTRDQAIEALVVHEDFFEYDERLRRYKTKKPYTEGRAHFRRTEVDQYDCKHG